MDAMNDELWNTIQSFEIGSSTAELSFVNRLARENNWTLKYAERVIQEYRRYVYLVAKTRSELTPSDPVDQVWHLHLTYTHSYWKELCAQCLGFELHHHPTAGGRQELLRFKKLYRQTLSVYREYFGHMPPEDIWQPPEQRFRQAQYFKRINLVNYWLLPKMRLATAGRAGLLLVPLTIAACSVGSGEKGLMFWVKVIIGVIAVYYLIKFFLWLGGGRGGGGSGGSGGCGSGCGGGCS